MFFKAKTSGYLTSAAIALSLGAGAAHAGTIEISITNNQGAAGAFLTPLLSVFHDGTYDAFDAGSAASAGVEALAEEGNPAPELAGAANGRTAIVVGNPDGFGGAPVIDPGETASAQIDLDPTRDVYFSYLSMIIPSNDAFIGNDNPFAIPVFDAGGAFVGGTFAILASDIWDAGTEVNNGLGAAFSTTGGISSDENGLVGRANLDYLIGTATPAGTVFSDIPSGNTVIATITLSEVSQVPLPAGLPLLATALGLLGLRRRLRG